MTHEQFCQFVDLVAQKLARCADDKSAFAWTCEKMRAADEFEGGAASVDRLLRLLFPTVPIRKQAVFSILVGFLAGSCGLTYTWGQNVTKMSHFRRF